MSLVLCLPSNVKTMLRQSLQTKILSCTCLHAPVAPLKTDKLVILFRYLNAHPSILAHCSSNASPANQRTEGMLCQDSCCQNYPTFAQSNLCRTNAIRAQHSQISDTRPQANHSRKSTVTPFSTVDTHQTQIERLMDEQRLGLCLACNPPVSLHTRN